MENKDIRQIVLQKIKESGIKPISKNVFNLKKVLFWSLVGFSIIIGAVSFSVILSMLFNNEWYLFGKLGLSFIFRTMPYFWFVFLAIFTILGDFYYRKTFLGYRHRTITIVGVYIFITMISGSVLYVLGTGKVIEESLSQNVPVYRVFVFDRDGFWVNPSEGFLSGKIIEINNNLIKVIDINKNVWVVNLENSLIDTKAKIKIGENIKIIGDIDDSNNFSAEQIHPSLR